MKPQFVGADFASGPDTTALALKERSGLHVIMTASRDRLELEAEAINPLNARRKPEREVLAMVLETLARRHGAEVERRDSPAVPGYGRAGIDLNFKLNGVGAMVNIDDVHGGVFVLIHWHNTEYPSRNFSSRFCVNVDSLGSGRPHHKATSHPRDWYSLAMLLDAGLYLAAREAAFAD